MIFFPISNILFILLQPADDIRQLPFIQPDHNYSFFWEF
jgi:hypothetical protein